MISVQWSERISPDHALHWSKAILRILANVLCVIEFSSNREDSLVSDPFPGTDLARRRGTNKVDIMSCKTEIHQKMHFSRYYR
jgi:hypothetical protein